MKASRFFSGFVLFLLCVVSGGTLYASEWQTGRHSVLTADLDADSDQDILLQALSVNESIPGSYEISFDVSTAPEIDHVILRNNGSNNYSVEYQPAASLINSVSWVSGAYQAIYADFDGNNLQDILLQVASNNSNSIVILAPGDGATPAVHQVITGAALGWDFASATVSLTPADINADGRSDLIVHKTSTGEDKTSLADPAGYLQPLMNGTSPCSVGGELDTDCDTVIDVNDDFPFDPTVSTDTDRDGISDNLDADDDNDGISDGADTGLNANGDTVSYSLDKLNGNSVGVLKGQFDVSTSGKPNYRIPIQQTPSVGDIAPDLALMYSGQSGNDIAGVGWYLDGLSKITRCTTTLSKNGFINPIDFNSSDLFCLNGERLIAINGVYGADGTEYRTENESYSKVISHAVVNCSPQSFEVWRKDGRIEYYGETPNSRRVISRRVKNTINGSCDGASNLAVIAEWVISKVKDREGNQATYTYNNDTTNGSYLYIQEINFNSNKTIFSYENRLDRVKKYADGFADELPVRLTKITTYQDSNAVRAYHLGYTYGQATGRSRLVSVKECARNTCLKPVTFTWDAGTEQPQFSASVTGIDDALTASSFQNQQYQLGDVNGDGQQDLIWTYLTSTGSLGRVVYHANSSGTAGFTKGPADTDAGYLAASIPVERQQYLVGDVNGDGRDDLVWMAQVNSDFIRTIYLSNGTGFVSQGYEVDQSAGYASISSTRYHLADMNGDGRKDLVWTYISQNNAICRGVYLAYQDGTEKLAFGKIAVTCDSTFTPAYYQNNTFELADVDGDGRSDLIYTFMVQGSMARVLYLANDNGSGFSKVSVEYDESLLIFPQSISNSQMQLGDINSDGKADLVWSFIANNQLGVVTYLADADGLGFTKKDAVFQSISGISPMDFEFSKTKLADLNGDGKSDLIYSYQNYYTFGWVSLLANQDGEGFTYAAMGSENIANPLYPYQDYLAGDISGDGKTDLVWAYTNNVNEVGRVSSTLPQSHPDHITEITDGWGAKIKVSYKYMADEAFYTRGTTAQYPLRDDTGLSYLVSKVEKSNGQGAFNLWDYKYQGATTDLSGRGFLGFEKRIITDNQTGFITTESYQLEYPFLGQLKSVVVEKTAGTPIQKTYHHWKSAVVSHGGTPVVTTDLRYLDSSISLTYDLVSPANLIKVEVTDNTYNPVTGNLTNSVVSTGLGLAAGFDPAAEFSAANIFSVQSAVTTNSSYTDDIDNDWRLGFLETQTVTYEGYTGQDGTKPANKSYTHTYTPYGGSPLASMLVGSKVEFSGISNLQRTTAYGRDNYGNVTSTTVSAKDYDGSSLGSIVESVDYYVDGLYPHTVTKGGLSTTYTYNKKFGLVEKTIDPRGAITSVQFDDFGRTIRSTLPDGSRQYVDFDNCVSGCPTDSKYAIRKSLARSGSSGFGAPPVTTYFDMLEREIHTASAGFDGTDVYVDTAYDSRSRVATKSEPYYNGGSIHNTSFTYDNLNRVLTESRPDGGVVSTAYAHSTTAGYATEQTKTLTLKKPDNSTHNIVTVVKSNALGQMVESVDGNTVPVKFAYDPQGNLRWTRVNGNTNTTITVATDVAGNRTLLDDPDAGTIQYAFDALGRMRVQTQDPGGLNQTTTVGYDNLNRMISRVDSAAAPVGTNSTWSYYTSGNGKGLLQTVTSNDYSKTITYDGLGRLATESVTIKDDPEPRLFSYTYDGFSRLASKTYPSGFVISTRYNGVGYKDALINQESGNAYWLANTADARGNVTNETYGNGVITQRSYDATNGVIQTIKTGPSSSPTKFQDWSYQFDSEGNLYQRKSTRNPGTAENLQEDFTYDNLYRLQTAITSGDISRTVDYDYDVLGNLINRSDLPNTLTYDMSNGAGVHGVSKVGSTNYSYDAKGNMIANGTRTLAYTVDNNPSSIMDTATTDTLAFQYGPDRQRIYQHHENTTDSLITDTKYYESEFEVVTRNGEKVREKTYIGGFMVLTRVYNQGSSGYGADLSYLHKDHLGSTDAITTQLAADEGRMLFDPFGKRRQDNGADETPAYKATLADKTFNTTTKGYTGHEQLDSVGLIHMGGRVYDPYIGRFLSPDEHVQYPEFTQSYNRYSYVLNNPLSYTDPTGEEGKSSTNNDWGHESSSGYENSYAKKTVDAIKKFIGFDGETEEPESKGGDKNTQKQNSSNSVIEKGDSDLIQTREDCGISACTLVTISDGRKGYFPSGYAFDVKWAYENQTTLGERNNFTQDDAVDVIDLGVTTAQVVFPYSKPLQLAGAVVATAESYNEGSVAPIIGEIVGQAVQAPLRKLDVPDSAARKTGVISSEAAEAAVEEGFYED